MMEIKTYGEPVERWWRKKSLAANLMAFSGVMSKILTAEPRYMPK